MRNDEEPRQAVALKYEHEKDRAPRVVAKGAGYVAENIVKIARQSDVLVYRDRVLTAILMAVELDREIPPQLYKAVAEVLAYVYRVDRAWGNRRS